MWTDSGIRTAEIRGVKTENRLIWLFLFYSPHVHGPKSLRPWARIYKAHNLSLQQVNKSFQLAGQHTVLSSSSSSSRKRRGILMGGALLLLLSIQVLRLSVYLSQHNVQQVTKYINLSEKQSISNFFRRTGIWFSNFTWPTAIN